MMKRKYIFVFVATLVVLTSVIVALNYINRGHKDLRNTIAQVEVSSSEIVRKYIENEVEANNLYLNKVIDVEGLVLEVEKSNDVLNIRLFSEDDMYGIVCELSENDKIENLPNPGAKVVVRGLCTGILMDVVLVQAVIIK